MRTERDCERCKGWEAGTGCINGLMPDSSRCTFTPRMRTEGEVRERWLDDFSYTQDDEGRDRNLLMTDPVRLGWIQALKWVLNEEE